MIRLFEIQNYANNQIFDLYEINEVGQKYKRFRIQKQDLKGIMKPADAQAFEFGQLKTVYLEERKVETASSIIY
jgi:hypothetical protein